MSSRSLRSFLLGVLVVSGLQLWAADAKAISDAEAIGIQQKFFDAMIKQDAKAMETLSAEDLSYVHLSGQKQSKAEFLSWVSKMSFKKFDLQEHQVHPLGERAFALDGVVENTRGMHLRLATVWEQRPTGWQMVLLQYTEIPEPKKEAPGAKN